MIQIVFIIFALVFADWYGLRAMRAGRRWLPWAMIGALVALVSTFVPAVAVVLTIRVLGFEFVSVPLWLIILSLSTIPGISGWITSFWVGRRLIPLVPTDTPVTVFGSVLLDSYRELNSKKLFWVILGLSGLVVLTFGSIGFDETGMSMFFGLQHIDNDLLTRDSYLSKILYRSIFATFMLGIWLTWIATILALISTTTIFPDFIANGAIDIVLAKPISRIRLFFCKYMTGLLFVTLQITIFCVGVFLCLGFRLGDWEWLVFAAIPLVVMFYSYLFSVNVLFGVWTRSALTALLLTFLMWFSLYSVNATETVVNMIKTGMVIEVEEMDEEIARLEDQLTLSDSADEEQATAAQARIQDRLETVRTEKADKQGTIDKLEAWHRPARVMQAVLPKTGETIALLDRWLRRDTDINIMDILTDSVARDDAGGFQRSASMDDDRNVERRMEDEMESRSELFVIGTSLAFEAVILALACFIFVRRDY